MGYSDDPVRTIMKRTIANLRYIDLEDERLSAQAKTDGQTQRDPDQAPFEATQLLNSFLGALVQPWETLRSRSSQDFAIGLDEAEARGWPVLHNLNEYALEAKSYAKMLSNIRNGFAHGNIELLKDAADESGRNDISGIKIWNTCPSCNCKTWVAKISLSELKEFLEFFEKLADDRLPRQNPNVRMGRRQGLSASPGGN